MDSLRGIAAISVVMAHITLAMPSVHNYFRFGVSGVDLFFIISGYVIYMSVEKTNKPLDFVVARIGRLYPVYWVSVFYTFILFVGWSWISGMQQQFNIYDLFANLSMFQYYLQSKNIIATSWTLLIEMLFYILIFILFVLKKLSKIEIVGMLFIILSFIYSLFLKKYSENTYQILKYYLPLINYFPLFFSGILFYKINTDGHNNIFRWVLIALCFFTQLSLFNHGGSDQEFMSLQEYVVILLIYYFAFVLFYFNKLGFINNILTQFLGRISYCVYLIHLYPSGLLFAFFTKTKYFNLNPWLVIIWIVLPYIFISSYLLYKYVEMPGIKYFKRLKRNKSLDFDGSLILK